MNTKEDIQLWLFPSSNFQIAEFSNYLIIPNRIAAAPHIIFELEPEGEYHIHDQRGPDGQAGCIDEEQADILDRHT